MSHLTSTLFVDHPHTRTSLGYGSEQTQSHVEVDKVTFIFSGLSPLEMAQAAYKIAEAFTEVGEFYQARVDFATGAETATEASPAPSTPAI